MIFPGLSGGSGRGYVKALVQHLVYEKGYIVGVFHNRGVEIEYTSPQFADMTSSEEIELALNQMVTKYSSSIPDSPRVYFTAVGLSMGANLISRVVGEQNDECQLDALVSFNNPFDVWLAINRMRNTPYEKYLAREMRLNLVIRENQSEEEKAIYQ